MGPTVWANPDESSLTGPWNFSDRGIRNEGTRNRAGEELEASHSGGETRVDAGEIDEEAAMESLRNAAIRGLFSPSKSPAVYT